MENAPPPSPDMEMLMELLKRAETPEARQRACDQLVRFQPGRGPPAPRPPPPRWILRRASPIPESMAIAGSEDLFGDELRYPGRQPFRLHLWHRLPRPGGRDTRAPRPATL